MSLPQHHVAAVPSSHFDKHRATSALADAVVQALTAPRPSLDDVRRAVVRYARAARELTIAAEEMLASLVTQVRRALDALPSSRRTELLAVVEWWAIHGYYGAD